MAEHMMTEHMMPEQHKKRAVIKRRRAELAKKRDHPWRKGYGKRR